MSNARLALQISCLKRAAVFFTFLPHATALDHRIFPPAHDTCVIQITRDVAILTRGCQRFDISLSRSTPVSSPNENVVYFSQIVCTLHHRNRAICVGGSGFSVVLQHSSAPAVAMPNRRRCVNRSTPASHLHNSALPPTPTKAT